MTEYTTSSHAYREYMSARERTAYWIHSMSPQEAELYSPSVPPSVLDGLVPSSPPSEADSTDSTPPKMVLRYNDGRPDVPIPHPNAAYGMGRSGSKRHQEPNLGRSRTLSYNHSPNHTRSGSSSESPSYRAQSRRHDPDSRAPEEIRILPSYGDVPTSSSSSRPSHNRSRSVPRTSDRHQDHEPVPDLPPFLPPPHMQSQSPYYPSQAAQPHSAPPQQVSFAPQPHHQWPRHAHAKHPPAIIYAPSHHTQRPNYSPPAMFHHPPQMGPNGMIYSHSAPPAPGQYPPTYPTPYPSVGSHRHTSSAHDVRMNENRDRMRSLGRSTRMNPAESAETLGTEKSGSTYYVLPAHGQKVHVIAPSPEQSIVTATSTNKSPTTPYGFSGKKPFFQRLFHFNMFSSAGSSRSSSSSGRKLSRRHSIGASHRADADQGR
ncbi:hypothetical protein GALMADRAFT_71866 [Galerina marginata CBS 339.88]|uniref:Uncharacterized protein n=1 Tax=Galerina marginata (strain CBS 339.88) TaxID=685588 RepID=A0A067SS23_GALM3|nr:hypothetical protein GALMADRAFT_71866 [Galerina marginata CBS 339.88]